MKARDRIVAEIEPVKKAGLEDADAAWMAELVATGTATPPEKKMTKAELEKFLSEPVKLNKHVNVVAMLLEEREEGR